MRPHGEASAPYVPPQPCLPPCADCGAVTIQQVWHHATKHTPGHYTPCAAADGVTGRAHMCGPTAHPEEE